MLGHHYTSDKKLISNKWQRRMKFRRCHLVYLFVSIAAKQ